MGGYGSGHWSRWNSKTTTESQSRIDIRWLKKYGSLTPGSTGLLSWSCRGKESGAVGYRIESDRLVLSYQSRDNGGEWECIEDHVLFTWTPCNYGGSPQWLQCPGCFKRVVVLYGGKYFRCRHCHNLTYSSQQESKSDRLMRKARKIRKRLGASNNLFKPILFKPKNMHQETFDRLRMEADLASNQSVIITGRQLGII